MHGVPAIPVKCILQKVGEEVVKQFRLPRVANTFRSRAHNKDEKTIETRTLCRMRHSEVVQSLLKRTWNLLPRKLGTYPNSVGKSEESMSRRVKILPTTEQNKSGESCRISVRLSP